MARFTNEQAIAGFELEQLLMEYCEILDEQGGEAAMHLFDKDIDFDMGKLAYKGHDKMRAFYQGGKKALEGKHRTGRHIATNVRIAFPNGGTDEATVKTTFLLFAAMGLPPMADATLPQIVSDSTLTCKRDAKGDWLIHAFKGGVIFVGNDPVSKKNLVG